MNKPRYAILPCLAAKKKDKKLSNERLSEISGVCVRSINNGCNLRPINIVHAKLLYQAINEHKIGPEFHKR